MFRIGVSRDSLNISCVFWLHNVLRSMFSDVSIYEHGRWLGCWGSQIVAEGVKFKLQVGEVHLSDWSQWALEDMHEVD